MHQRRDDTRRTRLPARRICSIILASPRTLARVERQRIAWPCVRRRGAADSMNDAVIEDSSHLGRSQLCYGSTRWKAPFS